MAGRDRWDSIDGIRVDWIPAPTSNWGGPFSGPQILIIHDIEGGATAAINTLTNPGRQASVQHIADPDNNRFAQLVGCQAMAWGCGNSYWNSRAVQLEMPGFAGTPYGPKTLDYSARWLGVMAAEYGIPLVKLGLSDLAANPRARGVCGHMDIPDPDNPRLGGGLDHHGDPGNTYPWGSILAQAARVAGTAPGGTPTPPSGPGGPIFFPLTGFWVRGWFAEYFAAHGGVAEFGYPLSREFVADLGGQRLTVQYFERARLELHAGSSSESAVLRGRVGAELIDAANLRAFSPAAAFATEGPNA